MKIEFGINQNNSIDVTEKFIKNYIKGDYINIPRFTRLSSTLGDLYPNKLKTLFIYNDNRKIILVISERSIYRTHIRYKLLETLISELKNTKTLTPTPTPTPISVEQLPKPNEYIINNREENLQSPLPSFKIPTELDPSPNCVELGKKTITLDDEKKATISQLPITTTYPFNLPTRDDNEIRMVYYGNISQAEGILEMVRQFKSIKVINSKLKLTIIYNKIIGTTTFRSTIVYLIRQHISGLKFLHNLSHRDACYQMAISDFGIYRVNNNKRITEYQAYGLKLLQGNLREVFTIMKNNDIVTKQTETNNISINNNNNLWKDQNQEQDILFKLDKNKYDFSNYSELSVDILDKIYDNIDTFSSLINKYHSILFICNDYPGYGGAATNCDRLQKFYQKNGHNTFALYNTNIVNKYTKTDDYMVNRITNSTIKSLQFIPDLIIIKSFFPRLNLKGILKCPIYYLIGGIYRNSLDKNFQILKTRNDQDKYINPNVLNQIKNSDLSFSNSSHTQKILSTFYNINTHLFYSTFVPFYKQRPFNEEYFQDRKFEYGLIMSDFTRPIKNAEESLKFLADKENVLLIGKNSKKHCRDGWTCLELLETDKVMEYYRSIKHLVQDSHYESCSNVMVEGWMYGCEFSKNIVVCSTQYPGYGGAATNAYNIIKYLRKRGNKVAGIFFNKNIEVNYNPDKLEGIFIFSVDSDTKLVYKTVVEYLGYKPKICLCKNYTTPYLCRTIFTDNNIKIYYLVSGIKYFLSHKVPAQTLLKNNYKIQEYDNNLEKKSIKYCDKIICNSLLSKQIFEKIWSEYKNKLYKSYIDTSQLVVTYNNYIDYSNKNIDIMFCCSNFNRKQKGPELAYSIFNNSKLAKYIKIVVGSKSSDYFSNIQNCTCYDLIDNDEVLKIMLKCKFIINTSYFDANPNVNKEALSNKCIPIISNNIGCYEIYPEILVCDNFDNDCWIKKILYLLENYDDLPKDEWINNLNTSKTTITDFKLLLD